MSIPTTSSLTVTSLVPSQSPVHGSGLGVGLGVKGGGSVMVGEAAEVAELVAVGVTENE